MSDQSERSPDGRALICLPSGKRVWVPPGHIACSSGASAMPTGNTWRQLQMIPLPAGALDAAERKRELEFERDAEILRQERQARRLKPRANGAAS
jgi:hypothetical protein